MFVEFHDHLGNPMRVPATRVIVLDDYGNPISLAAEMPGGRIRTAHILDEEFNSLLEQIGITRTTTVVRVPRRRLRQPEF